jgi:hypothetical protein
MAGYENVLLLPLDVAPFAAGPCDPFLITRTMQDVAFVHVPVTIDVDVATLHAMRCEKEFVPPGALILTHPVTREGAVLLPSLQHPTIR